MVDFLDPVAQNLLDQSSPKFQDWQPIKVENSAFLQFLFQNSNRQSFLYNL